MDGAGKPNIYQRLHAVMGEIDYIQKEKKQGMNYSIVSHDKVTAALRPLLHKHGVVYHISGLTYGQDGNRTVASISVRFVNVDDPQDWTESQSFGYGVDSQDKGPGKALSYAMKYALLKTLGLETGDDPDHDQGAESNYKKTSSLGPSDFGAVSGELSKARSTKQWKILEPSMKAQKTTAELNRWWHKYNNQVWEMGNQHRWLFFGEFMMQGADKSDSKLMLDTFWSLNEDLLKDLKKENPVNHDSIIEYLTKRAEKLLEREMETINAG